jgi:hypothetical protein
MTMETRASFRISVPVRVVAALFLAAGLAPTTRAAAPVPQKGGSKTVYAIAVDSDSKLVTDLRKDEWAIREDGTDRAIVDLKPTTDPMDVVLIIDTSNTAAASISDLRTALQAFAKTLFAGPAPVTMSITDVSGSSLMVAKDQKSADEIDKVLARTVQDQTQNTVVLEALDEASKKLGKSSTPRRAIVVVNMDSVPEGSTIDSPSVIRSIVASGASLWVVTYENNDTKAILLKGGSGSTIGGKSQGGVGQGNTGGSRETVLARVPPATGGLRAVLSTPSALPDTLTAIGSAIVGQYAVTYTRPDGPMPKLVQMGDTRTGVKVIYPSTPIK